MMLVTNKGVYNLLPNNYGKCKRRIAIENIASITASQISDEFVLHVPEEYDYRFKSVSLFLSAKRSRMFDGRACPSQAKKDKVCEILANNYKKLVEKKETGAGKKTKLNTTYISQSDLKEKVVTKDQARTQTREDIARYVLLLLSCTRWLVTCISW